MWWYKTWLPTQSKHWEVWSVFSTLLLGRLVTASASENSGSDIRQLLGWTQTKADWFTAFTLLSGTLAFHDGSSPWVTHHAGEHTHRDRTYSPSWAWPSSHSHMAQEVEKAILKMNPSAPVVIVLRCLNCLQLRSQTLRSR